MSLGAQARPSAEAFVAALRAEHTELVAFVALLESEQQALVANDPDKVAALAQAKSRHLDALARHGEQRARFLRARDLEPNAAGMDAWLRGDAARAREARSAWRDLLAQAGKARTLNATNGELIARGLQQTRTRLSALQAVAMPNAVYGADGQFAALRHARSFSRV